MCNLPCTPPVGLLVTEINHSCLNLSMGGGGSLDLKPKNTRTSLLFDFHLATSHILYRLASELFLAMSRAVTAECRCCV